MRHVIALDQGTTSSRAIVFDEEGRAVAAAQREFRQIFPQPGWVEHDPKEIFATQRETARQAAAQSGLSLKDLMGIGITNQRETTIVWDRQSGEPIHNAIVWQDRRTAGLCERLRQEGLEPLFRERTGLLLDPYFSGTKIEWLLQNTGGKADGALFGTIDPLPFRFLASLPRHPVSYAAIFAEKGAGMQRILTGIQPSGFWLAMKAWQACRCCMG